MADLCAFNLQWVRTHEILMFAQLSERGSPMCCQKSPTFPVNLHKTHCIIKEPRNTMPVEP